MPFVLFLKPKHLTVGSHKIEIVHIIEGRRRFDLNVYIGNKNDGRIFLRLCIGYPKG